ncbi:uncharacterized protein LOC121687862 isoform X1 [Alosa sapidissima]|uniref:uncharacterized protein LOC121687862 isoform X1 n=2 Tax=Alosa sapidissima TaxID=34773 RepID=UPI001C0886D7|nr:uncharacterized protein LOC121687862 isoform X1 [Alosa sapidissima]
MRAVIPLLVLLFSMCGAQTQSTQTEVQTESQSTGAAAAVTTTLDVSAELRELRDMVVEQRVLLSVTQKELQNTKSLLYKMETENDAQNTEMAVLKTRLAASETEVLNLRKETAAQTVYLSERLAATETDMKHVKKDTTAQHTDLTTMQPKVAFSAGLGLVDIQAGITDLNLVFTRIITNVGQAYSDTTGFFTAPVRGVYYFRFTVMDLLNSHWMAIILYRNGERIMFLNEHDTDGHATYLSSGVTLQLEVGDTVNMGLPASRRLLSRKDNHSTFSGFLLFPL